MHAPSSIEELSTLMTALARDRRTLAFTGGASPLDAPYAKPVDELVSTSNLNGIVEYAPSDQVVEVLAGTTIAQLQSTLREHSQRLALDPPEPEHTTIGGAIAANLYGALRTRFGTAKDFVIGMTLVRADGVVARGGGKVVKNVAGFDVPKLMIGSYGTLAGVASVTLRLHPLHQTERNVMFDGCSAAEVRAMTNKLVELQLEPAASCATYDGQFYEHCIRFEGFADGVAAQAEKLGGEARMEIDAIQETARTEGALRLKISALPSHFEAVHLRAIVPLYETLVKTPQVLAYPSVGTFFAGGDVDDVPRVIAAVNAARAVVESLGGTLVLTAAPAAIRDAVDPWGTPPPAFALMRELKSRFDPERRLHPGAFVGGL
ncbi:MAG: FAD-binding oxidoreductase [Candidatus Eremiobacteraeota bacterium]|nr:FAD-binding oxidoreductase [Candidatus Eremiobacteraeota bacterium]